MVHYAAKLNMWQIDFFDIAKIVPGDRGSYLPLPPKRYETIINLFYL